MAQIAQQLGGAGGWPLIGKPDQCPMGFGVADLAFDQVSQGVAFAQAEVNFGIVLGTDVMQAA